MTFQPEKITREDVIKAINDIENGLIGYRRSTKFNILYRGRTYPPKDIMRQAHKYATGLYEWLPTGGEPTNKYLKALGFEVVNKDLDKYTWIETHSDLVTYLLDNENKQVQLIELLKDVGITGFEDLDVNDVSIPLTEIEPFTFFCYIYKHGPEKRLELLKNIATKLKLPIPEDDLGIPSANAQKVWLFPFKKNRNNNEIHRLWTFFKKASYLELNNELFQDVLTITNVGKIKITEGLFYLNPIEYFPLNGPTKPYLKEVLGIDSDFNSFNEYQNILEKIRDTTNKPFYQLSYEAWQWNDNRKQINYWIFQGSPKIYDTVSALNNNAIASWTVSAHKDKIKEGDKFILWLTGVNAGCYALGTITSEVAMMKEEDAEMRYYLSPTPQIENTRVKVVIDKNFASTPILWKTIENTKLFKDFKAGNQGTNFTATRAHYDYFNAMNTNDLDAFINLYIEACQKTDWLNNELYKFEWAKWLHDKVNFDEISSDATIYQIAMDSQKVAFTGSTGVQFIKQGAREQMSKYIGIDDIRYFREFKNGKTLTEIGFENRNMSFPIVSCWLSVFFPEKIYPISRTSFADVVRKLFNAKVSNSNIAFIESLQHYCLQIDAKLKTKTDYQTTLKDKLQLNELSQLEYNWAVQDFLLYLDRHPEIFNTNHTSTTQTKEIMSANSLNQILYGPPGTGKTYHTINKALSIIEGIDENELKKEERRNLKNRFDDYVKKGQIVFTTFHQSMSYEDFIEGIKPIIEEDAEGGKSVIYDVEGGIFKQIVEEAKKVRYQSEEVNQNFTFDDAWEAIIKDANLGIEKNDFLKLTIQTPNLGLKIVEITEKGNLKLKPIYSEDAKEYTVSFSRTKKLQEVFPDLSVIKNIDKEFRSVIGGSNSTAYWAVLNYINQKIKSETKSFQQKVPLSQQPYIIIIDEINRGNVSQIFGELITLIEEDKRLGKDEALEVTLPYSKEKFGVPPNLYIIGTMNTADRSVEALDTALRRRFSFVEMPPRYDLDGLNKEVYGYSLKDILFTINKRIVRLLNSEHAIGHSYFLNKDEDTLVDSFYRNIIPLLQEYFFGDYGKMMMVLGDGFVTYNEWSDEDKFFASYSNSKNDYDVKDLYSIQYYIDNKQGFAEAIKKLMNK